jgi:hypothetical protein
VHKRISGAGLGPLLFNIFINDLCDIGNQPNLLSLTTLKSMELLILLVTVYSYCPILIVYVNDVPQIL